jgi:hypothetical protein
MNRNSIQIIFKALGNRELLYWSFRLPPLFVACLQAEKIVRLEVFFCFHEEVFFLTHGINYSNLNVIVHL